MDLSKKISKWIKEQVDQAGKKGIVVGLSGGIDSAVTAVLSKMALEDNVLGLIMPCGNQSQDEKLALEIAKKFSIRTKKINLAAIHKDLSTILPQGSALAMANLKPRLRMMMLYYYANTLNYLVAGTGNKSELAIGYFTKHGDGGCDILPLGELLKTEVRSLAKDLRIPGVIIRRPPTAGLWKGQTDEGEMGVTYQELDNCLEALEQGRVPKLKDKKLTKIKLMIKNSKHKRDKTPIFKKK
ncbi:MAG TPA: NAD(+) synthase [Candidatus Omnitrophota bacterium]|nr:NAD(+) synthase [Candidatus Omnitrophota bacterium]HPT39083.1 NAD(+) synthase [Candidatus Omnitrophota bacterium]